jgi:hypothetical protein
VIARRSVTSVLRTGGLAFESTRRVKICEPRAFESTRKAKICEPRAFECTGRVKHVSRLLSNAGREQNYMSLAASNALREQKYVAPVLSNARASSKYVSSVLSNVIRSRANGIQFPKSIRIGVVLRNRTLGCSYIERRRCGSAHGPISRVNGWSGVPSGRRGLARGVQ